MGNLVAMYNNKPSMGGIGKSGLINELDALGGILPKASDYASIHYRILNKSKGEAVQSLRAQIDRNLYKFYIQNALKNYAHNIIESE